MDDQVVKNVSRRFASDSGAQVSFLELKSIFFLFNR